MDDSLSYREFVRRAIFKLREEGEVGIHLAHSGFTKAFFEYYGHDPQGILDELCRQDFIRTFPVEDGVMIYLPSVKSTETDEHLFVQSPRRIETIKRGEIILLWVAGLWTLLLTLFLLLDIDRHFTSGDLIWLLVASLPVWIICGLIWATFYGRSRSNPTHNPSAGGSSVQKKSVWAGTKNALLEIIDRFHI